MNYNYVAASGLIIFLSSTITSFFVLFKANNKKQGITWAIFSISVALWGLGLFKCFSSQHVNNALFWGRFLNLSAVWIPIFFYTFVSVFIDKVKKLEMIIYYSITVVYFVFMIRNPYLFIKEVKSVINFSYYPIGGSFYAIFPVFFAFLVFIGIIRLVKFYLRSSLYKKNQIRYLLMGIIIGFSGGATAFPISLGLEIYPFGIILAPLYIVGVAYSIIKYHLMDIKLAITRSLVFSFVYIVILAIPLVIISIAGDYLFNHLGPYWVYLPVLLTAIIASLGPTIYNKLKNK
ncbi:MAG: histidine kinase N-terminal 7TM domain-containing protein, partial [Elusimicrobiota bacterium]